MRTSGRVTWFDAAKGEGCVLSEGGVLAAMTRAVLAPFRLDALLTGAGVDCEIGLTDAGLTVTAIYEVTGGSAAPGQLHDLLPKHGPLRVKGRVQWFDQNKGFGFIVADSVDVLMHRNMLAALGFAAIGEGAIVEVDVVRTLKGFSVSRLYAVGPGAQTVPLEDDLARWYGEPNGYGFVVSAPR